METIRAFVALELDATSVRRVMRVSDRLRMASGAPSATWTPPARAHVTLKFMGELPATAVAPLGEALAALAGGKKAPRPGTFRLEAFPSAQAASVVVIELEDPDGGVAKLATKVEKLAEKYGVKRESRAYRPHVTLARLKMPYDARRWLKRELAEGAGECRATRLTLYRSDLGSAGSVYVPLRTWEYEVPSVAGTER